jgi:hypothetical protein
MDFTFRRSEELNAALCLYLLFTVATAGDASREIRPSHNAKAVETMQELGTNVDIKTAILTGLIGVIAFFSHRSAPATAPRDQETV